MGAVENRSQAHDSDAGDPTESLAAAWRARDSHPQGLYPIVALIRDQTWA